MNAKLKIAMVGGAVDSFMGPVHRIAATMDGHAELVAGSFSRNTEKNRATAAAWNVPEERVYTDYRELLRAEAGELDYIMITTPNNTHVEIATAAIGEGLAVSSDKPLGISSAECADLIELVHRTDTPYMVTHNYSGYPMIKESRAMCAAGDLGSIHRVVVEMPQGWLQGMVAAAGGDISVWRTDPKIVGPSLATADVGTHALHLAEYVTGLTVEKVLVDMSALLPSSPLENDVNILVRFDNGAAGVIMVSEFATGDRNPFRLRVYGTRLGIEWVQETPERLVVKELDGNERILYRGHSPEAESSRWSRIPVGHPEGYLEAFANLYSEFHRELFARKGLVGGAGVVGSGESATRDYPGVREGIHGLNFVEAVLRNVQSKDADRWTALK
jgi:predicted dehydrogenase